MSEQTAEATATETKATEQTEQPKPSETVDFWKGKAREQEKRAKENADAAKRLAEIEDAQKTEAEKTADRIAKADAEVASVPAKVSDALRTHLVELHKIEAEDAELFLTATEPDLLLKQVTRLLARSDEQTAAQKKTGNRNPREGNNPSSEGAGDDRAFVRELFGRAQAE
jgi:predicted phage tail protein